jgi:hypothetical protein
MMTEIAVSPLAIQLKQLDREIRKLETSLEEPLGAAVKAMLSWELALLVSEHAALVAQMNARPSLSTATARSPLAV